MTKAKITIDAEDISYCQLNEKMRKAVSGGVSEIELKNVCGQRFIAAGFTGPLKIKINGVAGADLGVFMNGPVISVLGNVQDACGNTMEGGEIIVYGSAGDLLGHSMRGGKIFIRGDVGHRVGVHIKAYQEKKPVIVVGGKAGNFLGEYMAGGLIIVLGESVGDFVGTGMHGGEIFIAGKLKDRIIGKAAKVVRAGSSDIERIKPFIEDFCRRFKEKPQKFFRKGFTKLYPSSVRPYGDIWAY